MSYRPGFLLAKNSQEGYQLLSTYASHAGLTLCCALIFLNQVSDGSEGNQNKALTKQSVYVNFLWFEPP